MLTCLDAFMYHLSMFCKHCIYMLDENDESNIVLFLGSTPRGRQGTPGCSICERKAVSGQHLN